MKVMAFMYQTEGSILLSQNGLLALTIACLNYDDFFLFDLRHVRGVRQVFMMSIFPTNKLDGNMFGRIGFLDL